MAFSRDKSVSAENRFKCFTITIPEITAQPSPMANSPCHRHIARETAPETAKVKMLLTRTGVILMAVENKI